MKNESGHFLQILKLGKIRIWCT